MELELQGHFARHGGVHYEYNASAEEINAFVNQLPADKKESMFEVMQELSENGLITVFNDELFADGDGEIGGSEDC
ncbi:hypothetical protein BEP19_12385 [Ammoniphilus oxalaticus]|uniref:Uncharacterized protein n=1 Tax=Ammoniphilus oxalaticus TaxID=66863 RepID=A0A419SGU0_9BACL|nr:hypothetical protein [Ammoniphilus oxalaticus]RKD23021.1 hypothetical protein BEP19_12385 [Ammoniphilus oxalaticus]